MKITRPRVLVACERSQIVARAFIDAGCEAYSADIELCLGDRPDRHIVGDVSRILNGHCLFTTQDGRTRQIRTSWDMVIAHPPCTYLSRVSSVHMLLTDGSIDPVRSAYQVVAREFFLRCLRANAPHVCVENPIPQRRAALPPPTTIINPCEYGEPYTKATCLWLRNLPPLIPTLIATNTKSFVGTRHGSKARSMFFPRVAEAMATQWSPIILQHYE